MGVDTWNAHCVAVPDNVGGRCRESDSASRTTRSITPGADWSARDRRSVVPESIGRIHPQRPIRGRAGGQHGNSERRGSPTAGLLIRDVAGDLYRLPDPTGLDRKSRELLWAFVD